MKQSEIYEKVTAQLIEVLDQAEGEGNEFSWQSPFQNVALGMPSNALTGKPYRGGNVTILLLMAWKRGYPCNQWVTYNQAKQLAQKQGLPQDQIDRPIKQGEKASYIMFWDYREKIDKMTDPDTGEELVSIDGYYIASCHAVFNLAQTHIPVNIPELKTYDHDSIAALDHLINAMKDRPDLRFEGTRARYSPESDVVYCPAKDTFQTAKAYYSTLFHELAHSTGHETRLKRQFGSCFGDDRYGLEEVVAETAVMMVFGVLGLIPDPKQDIEGMNSIAYIQGWKKEIKRDPRAFMRALSAAQKAADYLLIPHTVEIEIQGEAA